MRFFSLLTLSILLSTFLTSTGLSSATALAGLQFIKPMMQWGTPVPLVTGLDAPYWLHYDLLDGDLYFTEAGSYLWMIPAGTTNATRVLTIGTNYGGGVTAFKGHVVVSNAWDGELVYTRKGVWDKTVLYNCSGCCVSSVSINPAGPHIYFADVATNLLMKLNPKTSELDVVTDAMYCCGVSYDLVSGNLYYTEYESGNLWKIPKGSDTPVLVLSGLLGPVEVWALADHLFFTEWWNGTVKWLPRGATSPTILVSGLVYPVGVAVDLRGNIYYAESGMLESNGTVWKLPRIP